MAEGDTKLRNDDFVVPELPIATWNNHAEEAQSDTLAPLIFEAWYVIALTKDVDRTLKGIKALGEPLVYYRTEEGQPVVLDDRCAHRRFPLSKGKLKGDTIQCGYHGFTYAVSGRCIWAPGVDMTRIGEAGLPFGVRAYPCAEKGPWLWVWMGKPERANPADIPFPDVELPPENTICGYKMNPANYMLLIENLCDSSHLHFLHGATGSSFLDAPPIDLPPPKDGVAWQKVIGSTETGGIGANCGDDPARLVSTKEEGWQFGPSLSFGYQRRERMPDDVNPDPPRPATLTVSHALTPADYRNTHQFFVINMSDPFSMDANELLHLVQDVTFEEDVVAMRDMRANIDGDVRPGRVETHMAYDRNGVKMRRILKAMKERELNDS